MCVGLAWLYLHHHWLAMLVPHLPDVQELMGVPVVARPAVHKHPGAAAATVHHQAVIQRGVAGVCRLHVCDASQVSSEDKNKQSVTCFVKQDVERLPSSTKRTCGSGFPL